MNVGSLGLAGGMAASPLAQRAADSDKTPRAATEQARAAEGQERAEDAAGIGHTEEDSEAGERDADGRRPWELDGQARRHSEADEQPPAAPRSLDPTGACGGELDLTG